MSTVVRGAAAGLGGAVDGDGVESQGRVEGTTETDATQSSAATAVASAGSQRQHIIRDSTFAQFRWLMRLIMRNKNQQLNKTVANKEP